MKLIVGYNLPSEIRDVERILRAKDFWQEHGYDPSLPVGVKIGDEFNEKIAELTKKEFTDFRSDYLGAKEKILRDWKNKGPKVISAFDSSDLTNYPIPEKIFVILTRYGPGGSYWLPNRVVVKIYNDKRDILETIVHEIVHLIIEKPLINKHQIPHREKEALVDYLMTTKKMSQVFPGYRVQKFGKPSEELLRKIKW